eukprot:s12_g12.t1
MNLFFYKVPSSISVMGTSSARSELPSLEVTDTEILKIQVFQDEVNFTWAELIEGPIKTLIQLVPLLRLCPGRQCGKDCQYFHAPVGESLQGVIMDLWARSFCNQQGKATKAEHAHYFQVMMRIPAAALDPLLRLAVRGVYIEPRSSKSKGPHELFSVIWLAGHDRDQAMHKLRTCTHGIAIARLHHRFGIRVAKINEKKSYEELRPDDDYVDVEVKQVYSIFPVPFGLQRAQVVKLLAAWKWAAKPLQPTKGNLQGQTWLIGAQSPPPNKVLPGFDQDILITLQKEVTNQTARQPLVASNRTKRFLKEGHPTTSSANTSDPWQQGEDPWAHWQKPSSASTLPSSSTTRSSQLHDTICKEIQNQIKQAPPGLAPGTDVQRLEVNIAELQAQGNQFKQWFHETGHRLTTTETQLGQLRQIVEQQGQVVTAQIAEIQQEVDNKTQILQNTLQGSVAAMSNDLSHQLDTKLNSQFDRFEAMLAKKSRCE